MDSFATASCMGAHGKLSVVMQSLFVSPHPLPTPRISCEGTEEVCY